MFIELDFRYHVPIYVQIVERIKHLVATEVLEPGDQLPTVRQLAADLRVNFNTVARAYRILDQAGLVSTQQGRGTYMLESLPPERSTRLRQAALKALTQHFLTEAARLGFEPDEVAHDVEKLIKHWRQDGTPPTDSDGKMIE
ncbi:MAG: GntR family transcriptional regulator [Anaerolineales bacterium]|nr:MAG: GntR family transcriptional regulator [Anaerolineales bacterium]